MSRRIRRFPPQMDSDGADVTGDLIEMDTLEQRYLGLVARIR